VSATHRSFWIAQLAGWSGYTVILWLSSLPLLPEATPAAALAHLGYKATWAGTGLLTSIALWRLYERLLPLRPRTSVLGSVAVAASLVFGLVWALLARVITMPGVPLTADFLKGATTYGVNLLAWSAIYFSVTYRRQLEDERERSLRATALASQAQLQMLRYQINPHFLFNALNSLRALIDEDKGRARQMVTELSELFRYSLLNARAEDVPLADELDAIESYLAIQKIRFEERLDVTMEVDDGARATRLPGFLIHPLVENAVKYGMETSGMPLTIAVKAGRSNGCLRVEVVNSGRWREPAAPPSATCTGTGTGLANVRARLEQLFPGRHSLEVGESDGRVKAVLELALPPEAA